MTQQERLELYKIALQDYINKDEIALFTGFCFYFIKKYGIDVYGEENFSAILPELWQQRPEDCGVFWYWGIDELRTEKRIANLQAAIQLCNKTQTL